jgi:hypothetical protein
LQPFIDVRRGSPHPLAWRGGDYLDELRATYRRDRGIFALVRESGVVVMGCRETLPVLAGAFRALGWEVDESFTERVARCCIGCGHRWTGALDCPECGEPGEPVDDGRQGPPVF